MKKEDKPIERKSAKDLTPEEVRKCPTLCWSCQNAVPALNEEGRYIRGCPWSISQKPVKGWDAVPCVTDGLDTFHVENCPMYVKDPPRQQQTRELLLKRKQLVHAIWEWRYEN